jgi:hypothetical protein
MRSDDVSAWLPPGRETACRRAGPMGSARVAYRDISSISILPEWTSGSVGDSIVIARNAGREASFAFS